MPIGPLRYPEYRPEGIKVLGMPRVIGHKERYLEYLQVPFKYLYGPLGGTRKWAPSGGVPLDGLLLWAFKP